MKKLFMVCYGGGHVRIIAPLYLHLKNQYDVIILALTVSGDYLEQLNIPFVRMSDFGELITSDVISYGDMLVGNIDATSTVPLNETIAYHGLSFKDLIEQEGSDEAALIKYKKLGRSCFLPIPTLTRILKILNPDLVIATNAPRSERAALIAAKKISIPTICINDNAWIENGVKDVAELNCADIICVLSAEVKNALLSVTDFPKSKIFVTGTPVFDHLKSIKKNAHKVNAKVTVLLADCELPDKTPSYPDVIADKGLGNRIRSKLNQLSKLNNWNMIFRPHPTQTYDYKDFTNITISEKSEDLHELLMTVDVIVTAISTVGLEGKVLSKGLVSIEGSVYKALGSYEKLGLSTGVWNESQLENAIKNELMTSKGTSKLYSGCSTENIAKIIKGLL